MQDRQLTTGYLGSRNMSAYQSTQTDTERDDHQEKHPRQLLKASRTAREIIVNNGSINRAVLTTEV